MSVLLQISDPHFGTEVPRVVESLVDFARHQAPDLVLLTGDITQRARRAQFRAAREFFDRLRLPVLAIPGNHDIPLFDLWTRLRRPYARHIAAFGADLEPTHVSPEVVIAAVNTTRAYRHKHGEVSPDQIERVARVLECARPQQLRIVAVHQPIAVPQSTEARNRLRGCEPALARWADAGADIVIGGHIHLPYVIELPGLSRRVWAVQAGTAVSRRVRNGVANSVNVLRWGNGAPDGACHVERWDYSAQAGGFTRAATTRIVPDRR